MNVTPNVVANLRVVARDTVETTAIELEPDTTNLPTIGPYVNVSDGFTSNMGAITANIHGFWNGSRLLSKFPFRPDGDEIETMPSPMRD